MIHIKIEGRQAEIACSGSSVEVAAELATAVNGIYQGLATKDAPAAGILKAALQHMLNDGSPVWNVKHDMTVIAVPIKKKGGTPTDQS